MAVVVVVVVLALCRRRCLLLLLLCMSRQLDCGLHHNITSYFPGITKIQTETKYPFEDRQAIYVRSTSKSSEHTAPVRMKISKIKKCLHSTDEWFYASETLICDNFKIQFSPLSCVCSSLLIHNNNSTTCACRCRMHLWALYFRINELWGSCRCRRRRCRTNSLPFCVRDWLNLLTTTIHNEEFSVCVSGCWVFCIKSNKQHQSTTDDDNNCRAYFRVIHTWVKT